MACQKVCKQGRVDVKWRQIYLYYYVNPTLFAHFLACHPYIFLHFLSLVSVLLCSVTVITTDQHRKLHRQSIKLTGVTKAVFCSVVVSKQLNVAPYLCIWCPWAFPTTMGRDRAMPTVLVNVRNFTCALVSFPDQWPWLLVWERDWMCTCVQD